MSLHVIPMESLMPTTLTVKGQITIPKHIRDALGLKPGMAIDFSVNQNGQILIMPCDVPKAGKKDRFEAARGSADIKWRTNDLMKLLRGKD